MATSEFFRYSYKETKKIAEVSKNRTIGSHTITHNNRNVYIDGKIVFMQCSYGMYITKKAWNNKYNCWWDFNDTTCQKRTDFNYLKNIMRFLEMLSFIDLDEYMTSIEKNQDKYNKEPIITQY